MRLIKLQNTQTTSIPDSFLQNTSIPYKTKGVICEALSMPPNDLDKFIEHLSKEDCINFDTLCKDIEEFGWSFSNE